MSESATESSEREDTAECVGKPTGHSLQEWPRGLTAVTTELGDMTIGSDQAWDAIATGLPLVLRCTGCGVSLSVSLDVKVR